MGRLLKYSVYTKQFAYILRFSALHTKEIVTQQVKILHTEKKHYTRREEQPLPLPHPSKIIVDCLFCQQLVDSELGPKRKSNNDGKGFRLDKLLNHIQGCHKDVIMDGSARTLFDVGFSRA